MATLQVEIVTPEKAVYSGAASEVLVPCWEGELGVLPEHDALLSLLKCGVAVVNTAEGVKRWIIGRGFADIGGDHVTILTDRAETLESVDKDAARQELVELYKEFEAGKFSGETLKAAMARAEWAQAIVDA